VTGGPAQWTSGALQTLKVNLIGRNPRSPEKEPKKVTLSGAVSRILSNHHRLLNHITSTKRDLFGLHI
jgi:hypothetical protein